MNDFLDIAGIFLIACVPFVVLTVVFALWYNKALKNGRRLKAVDFFAGLFQMCAVGGFYCAYTLATDENLFLDLLLWEPYSDFWTLIVRCAWIFILFGAWTLLVRFVFRAGPNWMLHLTTILFFGLMTLYYAFMYLSEAPLLLGLLGLVLIPFTAFIAFCLLYFKFVNFKRCPVCHASGNKFIYCDGSEDLGTTTDHSVEYRHRTEHDSETSGSEYKEIERHIQEKYDVYKTRQHDRYFLHCKNCGLDWSADTSRTVHTDKNLNSVKTDTTIKTWRN